MPRGWLERIPGASGMQLLFRSLGRFPPMLMAWLAGRLSAENQDVLDVLRGNIRELDWIYGKLKFWMLVRLTQMFAVAYIYDCNLPRPSG